MIRVSYQLAVGEKGALVFETYAPQDAAQSELDAIVDKLGAVASRQRVKADIEGWEKHLEDSSKRLEEVTEDFKRLEAEREKQISGHAQSGRRGDYKLSATEENARKNTIVTVNRYKNDIEKTRLKIQALKKAVGPA